MLFDPESIQIEIILQKTGHFTPVQTDSDNMKLLRKFRRRAKVLFDRTGSEKFKNGLLQAFPFWIASLITGLVAVVYSRIFSLAEKGTHFIFIHSPYLFLLLLRYVLYYPGGW